MNATRPERRQKSLLREYVEAIVYALLLTVALRAFVLQAFRIPSESMLDTLLVGDYLFVNKLDYGAKIPFTETRLPAQRHAALDVAATTSSAAWRWAGRPSRSRTRCSTSTGRSRWSPT